MSSKKKIRNTLLIVLLSLFALTSLATPPRPTLPIRSNPTITFAPTIPVRTKIGTGKTPTPVWVR
jgi:hypothetical protein